MDYFDNGIICNLIEHVSYPSLIFGTFPWTSTPLPSPHFGEGGKRAKGEWTEDVDLLEDQV